MLSPYVGRLEGLAGLSVQDAELKLFAESPKPKGDEGSSARNGRSHADGPVGVGTSTDQARGGKEELGADKTESGETKKKTRNKNKAGKKKLAIVQRGPLLITHSGERVFFNFNVFFFGPMSLKAREYVACELMKAITPWKSTSSGDTKRYV